jgi:hypothetical protein
MFSAREAIIPGGIYDRSKLAVNSAALGRMFGFSCTLFKSTLINCIDF